MTIGKCEKCNNKGEIFAIKFKENFSVIPASSIPVPPSKSKEYCSCEYGRRLRMLHNQMRHPEYENPFSRMSDEEILRTLDAGSKDLNSIESEFNC